MCKDLAGSENIYFDEALTIKTSPHTLPFMFWGVCASPDNTVYIMDGSENWWPVERKDTVIVHSLYQRVASISAKYKTAI